MKTKTIFTWLILIASLSVFGFLLTELFVQQTILDGVASVQQTSTGDLMIKFKEGSAFVQQTALRCIKKDSSGECDKFEEANAGNEWGKGSCAVSRKSASCVGVSDIKVVVNKREDLTMWGRTDYDVNGWGMFGSCAAWMKFYGCTASQCDAYGGATCGGSSSGSTVECSINEHCIAEKKGNTCYAGKCKDIVKDKPECIGKSPAQAIPIDLYACKGEGALYRCDKQHYTYLGQVSSQRGHCQTKCGQAISPILGDRFAPFCVAPTTEQNTIIDEEDETSGTPGLTKQLVDLANTGRTAGSLLGGKEHKCDATTEIPVNIGGTLVCLPKPNPPVVTDVCGDDACTGSETKESCAADCDETAPVTCGNGKVDDGETCANCEKDVNIDRRPPCGDTANKCDVNPTLPECQQPLSLWEFIKLFVTENWVAVTVLGGLIVALIVAFATGRKKRGR